MALYSSLVFGAVHRSNALGTATSAIFQAFAVSFTGDLLYLTRRWAGTIVTMVGLGVRLWRRRHRIEPQPAN